MEWLVLISDSEGLGGWKVARALRVNELLMNSE